MPTSVKSRTRVSKASVSQDAPVKSKVTKRAIKRAAAATETKTKKEAVSQEQLIVERVAAESKLWKWTLYVKKKAVGTSSEPWKRYDHCANNAELVTGRKAIVIKD